IILVMDLDQRRLIDLNENAVRFFKMERDTLLARSTPLSPPVQPDGSVSTRAMYELLESTFAGAAPVFEWTFRDALGTDIPCEVRCVRLPSTARLVRASVTDITER